MVTPDWPLFELEARTPRLTLRYVDDELGARLVDTARRGIHDPSWMPFTTPWTDDPPEQFGKNAFQFWWSNRAAMSADAWTIDLAVLVDGEVVGATGLGATDFPVTRSFETGSWLGLEHQGRGLGTELRIATLHIGFLAFDGEYATTGAFSDNAASLGVTRRLGYRPNGSYRNKRRDSSGETLHYRMERSHFLEHVRRDDIEITGGAEAREFLGLSR